MDNILPIRPNEIKYEVALSAINNNNTNKLVGDLQQINDNAINFNINNNEGIENK